MAKVREMSTSATSIRAWSALPFFTSVSAAASGHDSGQIVWYIKELHIIVSTFSEGA